MLLSNHLMNVKMMKSRMINRRGTFFWHRSPEAGRNLRTNCSPDSTRRCMDVPRAQSPQPELGVVVTSKRGRDSKPDEKFVFAMGQHQDVLRHGHYEDNSKVTRWMRVRNPDHNLLPIICGLQVQIVNLERRHSPPTRLYLLQKQTALKQIFDMDWHGLPFMNFI